MTVSSRVKSGPGWLVLLFAAVALIVIGGLRDDGVSTPDERVRSIAGQLACPTCEGESVAESQATAALNLRKEITELVDAGELSDDEIISTLDARYPGPELDLIPSGQGLDVLVWALPVAAAVTALTGLGFVFVRWRRTDASAGVPTADERQRVAAALADDAGSGAEGAR